MDDLTLLPVAEGFNLIGKGRSSGYTAVKDGLCTVPISVGPQAKRLIYGELRQIIQARIRGESDDQIRELVKRLHADRQKVPA